MHLSYDIHYKSIKHAYIKIVGPTTARLSIPRWKRADLPFLEGLKHKARTLHADHMSKTQYLARHHAGKVRLRGKYTSLADASTTSLKTICLMQATAYADTYSRLLGYDYMDIRIKQLRSRWGSCSHQQNINLNLDLVHLDKIFLEYVVAHEVTHLQHKHHQKAFWSTLALLFPEYKDVQGRLRHIHLIDEMHDS